MSRIQYQSDIWLITICDITITLHFSRLFAKNNYVIDQSFSFLEAHFLYAVQGFKLLNRTSSTSAKRNIRLLYEYYNVNKKKYHQ